MKLFAILFSIYILSLSSLPCSDELDCVESKTKSTKTTQHNDHEEDTENCSPFCICACCGSVTATNFHFPKYITEKIPEIIINSTTISFKNIFFSSNFYGNIWQPPQL